MAGPRAGDDGHADTVEITSPDLDIVDGRYRIVGFLGSGGMGSVYRAHDLQLDETVALKRLRKELAEDPRMLARFRDEVRLARRVTHPGVARVFDIGGDDTLPYLTMELVQGEALGALLRRKGALPLDDVRRVVRGLCAALSAAHASGVVHHDLKPDNILLEDSGRTVITDFGIARLVLDAGRPFAFAGTPAYMAPEQIEGVDDADERVDIYALGAVLFEMLTGERVWPGSATVSDRAARRGDAPPDPRAGHPEVPADLADIVVRCLQPRRQDRYRDTASLAADLERAFARITSLPGAATAAAPGVMPAPGDVTVAVVPFRAGPDVGDYVAEGFTEDLVDTLSMARGIRVRPHSVVTRLLGSTSGAHGLGVAAGVEIVLEGSLRQAGALLRIAARATHVRDGFQVWAQRFDAAPGDLLQVGDRIAHAFCGAVAGEPGSAGRRAPHDPEAVDLYLRGREILRRTWSDESHRAVELLERAIARAPDDGNMFAGLALALTRGLMFDGRPASLTRSREVAERAVLLSPNLGESWVALALARMHAGEHQPMAVAVREGLARVPSSGRLHELVGRLQLEVGLIERARLHLETAFLLDPTLHEVVWELSRLHALQGDWAQADATLDRAPADALTQTSVLAARVRLATWRRQAISVPADLEAKLPDHTLMSQLMFLARDALATRSYDATRWAAVEQFVSPARRRLSTFLLQLAAEVLASLDEQAKALDRIERSSALGLFDVVWLSRCPLLVDLRRDPRHAAILASVEEHARPIAQELAGL